MKALKHEPFRQALSVSEMMDALWTRKPDTRNPISKPVNQTLLPHPKSHVETLVIYKLGFNQNYYTFASILLRKIALCRKYH